jgi:pilus assembly protein CpaE
MITESIRVVIALDENVDRDLVEATLPIDGRVNVTGIVHGLDAARAMDDRSAQLLLVACHGDSRDAVDAVRRWASEQSDRPVVALCDSAPQHFVRDLFAAGADDVVKLPEEPPHLAFALDKALARHSRREAEARSEAAPMICVLGPKGGTGKTVTASNLALGLASIGRRTAVVDLDLQFGDVGLALGLHPERTLYDLATSGGAIDADKLDAYLVDHEHGVQVLLAPVRPDHASAVTVELMRRVFPLLRSTHDAVVVDTPPDFTAQVIAAIDASSHVCMVGTLDSLALKNTKLGLETLDLMGYDPSAISLVLNRANTNVGLTRDDVEAIVGRKPDILVPSDRDVPRSINQGEPIIASRKRSPVAAAYRSLASLYVTAGPVEAGPNGGLVSATGTHPEAGSSNGHGPERRRRRLIPGRSG